MASLRFHSWLFRIWQLGICDIRFHPFLETVSTFRGPWAAGTLFSQAELVFRPITVEDVNYTSSICFFGLFFVSNYCPRVNRLTQGLRLLDLKLNDWQDRDLPKKATSIETLSSLARRPLKICDLPRDMLTAVLCPTHSVIQGDPGCELDPLLSCLSPISAYFPFAAAAYWSSVSNTL